MQMLPVKEMGKAIGQSQWTEELPHADDCPSGSCDDCHHFNQPFIATNHFIDVDQSRAVNTGMAYIHFSERIPNNHTTDILTPPPDYFI